VGRALVPHRVSTLNGIILSQDYGAKLSRPWPAGESAVEDTLSFDMYITFDFEAYDIQDLFHFIFVIHLSASGSNPGHRPSH
jgi:hypothetical protein